jgi:hypothetical protein
MSRKRSLDDGCVFFASQRDKEMFDIDRSVLGRIVYKNQYQFRRLDIIDRVKDLVKQLDEFYATGNMSMIQSIIALAQLASERFFQQMSMGLMLPISMVCLGSMGRIVEIVRRIPVVDAGTVIVAHSSMDDDEGIPIER